MSTEENNPTPDPEGRQGAPFHDAEPDAGTQLRAELWNVIRRYGQESGVTAYQAIGALQLVQQDVIDALDKFEGR